MFPVCTIAPWLPLVAVSVMREPSPSSPTGAPDWIWLISIEGNAWPIATSPLKPAVVALARLFAMTSCRI